MISSAEIKNVTFSNSVAGYKKDEVDILLDKIEVDLEKYEALLKKQEAKISDLEGQIEKFKESQNSIQNVLINAQKLADKIVDDAKNESRKIISDAQMNIDRMTEKSKLIAGELDAKASEKKERLENELSLIIRETENKKKLIERATDASVRSQQELFDKLKAEMATFRKEITEKYKEHLKLLSSIPESAELDPETSAKIIKENYKEPVEDENGEEPRDIASESGLNETKEPEETNPVNIEVPSDTVSDEENEE